jgi:hypothetical protein
MRLVGLAWLLIFKDFFCKAYKTPSFSHFVNFDDLQNAQGFHKVVFIRQTA